MVLGKSSLMELAREKRQSGEIIQQRAR